MVVGLSPNRATRKMCAPLSLVGLLVAGCLALTTGSISATPLPQLGMYGKALAAGVGLLLIMLLGGTVDRELESAVDRGRSFDSARSIRAEFYSFVLFSLTGLMLCAGSDDLIFLFLALELTSLPTYVMVSLSTSRNRSMEAGVKYFFLGALGAAMFLYGFALIYGGTGQTHFMEIHRSIAEQVRAGGINALTMTGLVIAVLGILFKVAAVPMHFYTPDVYQGSSATVAGFLAFVPKAAGFFALMLLLSLPGWRFGSPDALTAGERLPEALHILLWIVAAFTMTVGNILAIMQSSVKRILAYSSIAHTGYMIVGLVAGPGRSMGEFSTNGLAAIWFYLLAYGVTTLGAFAVVASLEKRNAKGEWEECDHIDDFRGLIHSQPLLAWVMVISAVGLLGLPPLVGFVGKLPLFGSAIRAGEMWLVIILALNSAIAAYYYLRLAYVVFIDSPETAPNARKVELAPFAGRPLAGALSLVGVITLAVFGSALANMAVQAGNYSGVRSITPGRAELGDSPSTGTRIRTQPVAHEEGSPSASSKAVPQ